MSHVCSWRHVRVFDNIFRPLVHRPYRIFGPFVKSQMTVMDVGCGAGWASIGLAKLVGERGRVFAVDLQREMLDMLEKRSHKAGFSKRIATRQCEHDDLRLDEEFDFVNAFWMVHEVPDRRAFMSQIRSCLKSGGKLLVAEPVFHVSSKDFEEMVKAGLSVGLVEYARPRIWFSRSVVFETS